MTRTTMTTAPRTSASDMATASASAQVGPASGSARSRRPSLGPRFDAPCASGPASAVAAVGASAVWHGMTAPWVVQRDKTAGLIGSFGTGRSAPQTASSGSEDSGRKSTVEARDPWLNKPTAMSSPLAVVTRPRTNDPKFPCTDAPTTRVSPGNGVTASTPRRPGTSRVRSRPAPLGPHRRTVAEMTNTDRGVGASLSQSAATMFAPRLLGQAAGPGMGGLTDPDPPRLGHS
jgi:hypothetical protein